MSRFCACFVIVSLCAVLPALCHAGDFTAAENQQIARIVHAIQKMPIPQTPVAYNGHYYQAFEHPEGIEWDDARARCEAMGGYLVIINDAKENDFLTSIGAARTAFHLGASEAATEGDWRWVDGSPMTYQNWQEGHPVKHPDYGRARNWLMAEPFVWPQWSNGQSTAAGFICEWDHRPESDAEQ